MNSNDVHIITKPLLVCVCVCVCAPLNVWYFTITKKYYYQQSDFLMKLYVSSCSSRCFVLFYSKVCPIAGIHCKIAVCVCVCVCVFQSLIMHLRETELKQREGQRERENQTPR